MVPLRRLWSPAQKIHYFIANEDVEKWVISVQQAKVEFAVGVELMIPHPNTVK